MAVTFIYATCTDTCPLLTAKMAGHAGGGSARFRVRGPLSSRSPWIRSATRPAVLARVRPGARANLAGWAFLTGTPARSTRWPGGTASSRKKTPRGDVDHTFLTSLVDQSGTLRVQYLGIRFDPDELLRDLRALVQEAETVHDPTG